MPMLSQRTSMLSLENALPVAIPQSPVALEDPQEGKICSIARKTLSVRANIMLFYHYHNFWGRSSNWHVPELSCFAKAHGFSLPVEIKPFQKEIKELFACPAELLKEVGLEQIDPFVHYLIELAFNPQLLLKGLKPIEEAIAEKLGDLSFDPEKDAPQYLVQGWGHFIPGPPLKGISGGKRGGF